MLLPTELFNSCEYSIVVLTFPNATMNRRTIVASLFLALSLTIAPNVSAQWVETDWPNMTTVRNIMVEGNNIYVGAQNEYGISLSTDEGVTWQYRNNGMAGSRGVSVRSFVHIGPVLFVAADTGSISGGIFYSIDSARTWKQVWAHDQITCLVNIKTILFF